MKRRLWDAKTKAKIVLEGLSGRPVGELCGEYQISQNLYYQWREKFLSEAERVFEPGSSSGVESRLREENTRLKQLIGALTVELKKSEGEL